MLINGQKFYDMMVSAANALDNNKIPINNMNVFPVPDGDTGINMTLTMSTIKALSGFDGTISDCAEKASQLILRAARGNSGAILSLFFRGMSKSFKGLEQADSADIAAAFKRGTEEAYKAVMNPTEGTILTVMRICAERAEKVAKEKYKGDVVGLFTYLVRSAEDALAHTPDQLPLLKEVNLVDAGGYGFVVVLSGMLAALKDHPVAATDPINLTGGSVFTEFNNEDIKFTYCTECIVEKSDDFKGEGTARDFNEFLCGIGDSVVFIDDEEIIKLHVHTNNPGLVMENALKYGALATVKVENMRKQHSAIIEEAPKPAEEKPLVAPIKKKYGFVTVCMGSGICDIFRNLGADQIIFGGQTMNPSTQDIIDGINLTPSEYVFVFPNNKNIYMVAEQAAKLVKTRKVVVLPTKNVPQGIASMIAFDPDASVDDNVSIMNEAIGNVVSMSVTQAVRDTTIEGEKIENGQYLGLVNGNIACAEDTIAECLEKLSDNAVGKSFITVFYGEGVSADEAEKLTACLKEKADSFAEINVLEGGQPLYPYIISLE
ncbi:MAG: DAK2 domain-containing protein [Clostridia bacterium]|nr:DAK2 domain-containing protein [Clostridia bacterium]